MARLSSAESLLKGSGSALYITQIKKLEMHVCHKIMVSPSGFGADLAIIG